MATRSLMLDAVAFHGEPTIAISHNLSGQQGFTSISSKQAFMRLFHQVVSLGGIYASKKTCIMVPLVQDFPTQKELARHALDKFHLTVHGFERVFTILDISLDIMAPWLSIDLGLDIHAFFNVHAIGWHVANLYAQLSNIISFCQLEHAS